LISKNTLCCRYGVFKVHAGRRPALQRTTATPCFPTSTGTVSQNSTAYGLLRRGRRYFQANRGIGRRSREIDIDELSACRSKSAPASLERR